MVCADRSCGGGGDEAAGGARHPDKMGKGMGCGASKSALVDVPTADGKLSRGTSAVLKAELIVHLTQTVGIPAEDSAVEDYADALHTAADEPQQAVQLPPALPLDVREPLRVVEARAELRQHGLGVDEAMRLDHEFHVSNEALVVNVHPCVGVYLGTGVVEAASVDDTSTPLLLEVPPGHVTLHSRDPRDPVDLTLLRS